MQQDAVPDQGSLAAGDFTFLLVPVYESFLNRTHTFDMHFFFLSNPVTTNLKMDCDPFGIFTDPISNTCDYFNWLQFDGIVPLNAPFISLVIGSSLGSSSEPERAAERIFQDFVTLTPEANIQLLQAKLKASVGFFCNDLANGSVCRKGK